VFVNFARDGLGDSIVAVEMRYESFANEARHWILVRESGGAAS